MFKERFTTSSFIEDDFNCEEFNEDVIYDMVSEIFAEDPIIKVVKKGKMPEGYSRIVMVEMDASGYAAGGSLPNEPYYHIIPDFTGVDIAVKNIDEYLAGSCKTFTSVPVANPIIPENRFKRMDGKDLEVSWINKGFNIFEPTPGQVAGVSKYFDEVPVTDSKIYLDRYQLYTKEEFIKNPDRVIVQCQFNPFHPSSVQKIMNHHWKDRVIKGEWQCRNKINRFNYDFNDKRYRLHSDVWLQFFPNLADETVEYLRMFDLVSGSDFVKLCNFRAEVKMVTELGVFVNLFSSNRIVVSPYSVIGPWAGKLSFDSTLSFCYVPYSCKKIIIDISGAEYCRVRVSEVGEKLIFNDGKVSKFLVENGVVNSRKYYVVRSCGERLAYMKCNHKGDACNKVKFSRLEGEVLSCPKARHKGKVYSLIPPLNQITLTAVLYDLSLPLADRKLNLAAWGIVGDRYKNEIIMDTDIDLKWESVVHEERNLLKNLEIDEYVFKKRREELSDFDKLQKARKNYESENKYCASSNSLNILAAQQLYEEDFRSIVAKVKIKYPKNN